MSISKRAELADVTSLIARDAGIKMSFKRVLLVNCNQPVSVMQFLI